MSIRQYIIESSFSCGTGYSQIFRMQQVFVWHVGDKYSAMPPSSVIVQPQEQSVL